MGSKRKYCPHCDEEVVLRVYQRHYQQYFDTSNNTWINANDESDCESGGIPTVADLGDEGGYDDWNCSYVGNDQLGESDTTFETADLDKKIKALVKELEEEDQAFFIEPDNDNISDNADHNKVEIWDTITETEINEDFQEESDGNDLFVPICDEESKDPTLLALANWFCLFLTFLWHFFGLSDACISLILSFFGTFFTVLGNIFPCLTVLTIMLPGTLYKLKQSIGLKDDKFIKYVVCPKCSAIYKFEHCYKKVGRRTVPLKCTHVDFPEHRQKKMRKTCGATLLKEVELSGNKTRLYPFKVYCYKPVIQSLTNLIKKKGFVGNCELWRHRQSSPGILSDIYDGRVWREHLSVDGKPFLSDPYNYALQLNLDWFSPYKHVPYSVGALYLVTLNLPRAERYKKENIMIVGLLPGPREPSLNINSFLEPFVKELQTLWTDGVMCTFNDSGKRVTSRFRAALLNVVADVPATRKLCGFVGHMARKGCSKCEKEFKTGGFGDKIDCSGFDPNEKRRILKHRHHVEEIQKQTTATGQNRLISKYGVRYSSLLKLPYFDSVRFHVIDPLHNLFLGTGKHIMKNVWLGQEKPHISKEQLAQIQEKIDRTKVPSSMGRMPLKIASNFGGFTGDQWKHWITLFSVFTLKGVLPTKEFEMWRLFVLACRYLCSPVVSINCIAKGHECLMKFCRQFEKLYGPKSVTPNMHYHTHLVDCILDYGPVYSFWTFPYERYNGMLAENCSSHRSVEIQIMRKFLNMQFLHVICKPNEFQDEFNHCFPIEKESGSLSETVTDDKAIIQLGNLSQGHVDLDVTSMVSTMHLIQMMGPFSMELLDETWVNNLKCMYTNIFGILAPNICGYIKTCKAVKIIGDVIGAECSRYRRSSLILAKWCALGGQIDLSSECARPGIVEYFFSQFVMINGKSELVIIAKVRWFQKHPSQNHYGKPVEVWCKELYEMSGPASFIPVQRIHGKFVAGFDQINRENIMCVIPLPQKLYV